LLTFKPPDEISLFGLDAAAIFFPGMVGGFESFAFAGQRGGGPVELCGAVGEGGLVLLPLFGPGFPVAFEIRPLAGQALGEFFQAFARLPVLFFAVLAEPVEFGTLGRQERGPFPELPLAFVE
jgi:hypothetical protein